MSGTGPSRIAFLTDALGHGAGGVGPVIANLQEELNRSGQFVVHLMGAVDAGMPEGELVHAHSRAGIGPFRYLSGLEKSVDLQRIELVHVHGLWRYASLVAARKRKAGMPVVISPHGMLDSWALAQSWWKKKVARLLVEDENLMKANCVHALSEREVQDIQRVAPEATICVIPNGVTIPPYTDCSVARGDPRRIVFVSRLHPKKGVEELIVAWALLEPQVRKDWILEIFGWGDDRYVERLALLVREVGATESIALRGPVFGAAKEQAYRSADIFVLPSKSEGLPMAVLEAWSYGVPVLMTRECNLSRGEQVGASRLTCSEAKTLAEDLGRMMSEEPQVLKDMGVRGRRLVEEEYT